MSGNFEEQEARANRIKGFYAELVRALRTASDQRLVAPHQSVQQLRIAAEALCYCVLLAKNRIGVGTRKELGELIQLATPFFKEHNRTLDALRLWGNHVSHAQGAAELVTAEHATGLFVLTRGPVEHLCTRVLNEAMPEDLSAMYGAIVGARPTGVRVGALAMVALLALAIVYSWRVHRASQARAVLSEWNQADNRHDVGAVMPLYADQVRFYQQALSATQCGEKLRDLFRTNPGFLQEVEQDSIVVVPEDWLASTQRVSFEKTYPLHGKVGRVRAYLVLNDELRIEQESDETTDQNVDLMRINGSAR